MTSRASFATDLERLSPATDVERRAVTALLAAIRVGAGGDDLRAAKRRLRDALLLATWQSPVKGERSWSGTLQGPTYPSHYERETLDPEVLERLLSTDTRDAVVFRSVACAREAHRHAAGYIAVNQPAKRDRLPVPEFESIRVLDHELGVLWLPATGYHVLRHLAVDVRKLGGAPTFVQLISGYLELEHLPIESAWCAPEAPSAAAVEVRPLRLRHVEPAASYPDGVVAECERALVEAHRPFLVDALRTECVLTSSGMSALASVLRCAAAAGAAVLVGKTCYPETGKMVKYFADRCDVRRIDEACPLDGILSIAEPDRPSPVVVLVEPVSNSARTSHVSELTGWAASEARDLPVCDIPAMIRDLGAHYRRGQVLVAVDASLHGPGPWLEQVAASAAVAGVQVVVWSSLQKHFMAGEDWSPGGYLLTMVPPGCDLLVTTAELRGTVDLAGTYEPALRLVARSAPGAPARAARLGEAAAWLATELVGSPSEVIHPARPTHPDHRAWVATGRPAVPFLFLRLGPDLAERIRAALGSGSPDASAVVQRNSFGFADPTIADIFPGHPDEIMRVAPGDPLLTPPTALLQSLRVALADGGSSIR